MHCSCGYGIGITYRPGRVAYDFGFIGACRHYVARDEHGGVDNNCRGKDPGERTAVVMWEAKLRFSRDIWLEVERCRFVLQTAPNVLYATIILYTHIYMLHNMYRQVNRLVSFLPPSGCVCTVHYIHTSQRHRSAVHTTHLKMLEAYTHTHTNGT